MVYWIIDALCFTAGLAGFILSFIKKKQQYAWAGPVWIVAYPILLEMIYNLIALCKSKATYSVAPRSRIVYHQQYNISFCGLEKCHPFDSQKYGNIYRRLIEKGVIRPGQQIAPDLAPRNFLLEKMTKWYLFKLCYTIPVCKYIQMPLVFLPAFLLRWRVLDPMLRATEGSVLACCVAEQLGWAINLSGGFHHANIHQGGGFCIYPDITMMTHYLRTRLGKRRIMIIDLDAHQGNGHQRDHAGDPETYIIDFYNHGIYPQDFTAQKVIKRDQGLTYRTTDDDFIVRIKDILKDIDNFSPQFVVYNAGTDILDEDPLGRLHISREGIIKRDQTIIEICLRRKIPVAMVLSGGYQLINAEIIADSIENLYKKFS